MMSKCFSGASDYVYLRSELGRKEKRKKHHTILETFLLELHMLQLQLIHESASLTI